MNIAFSSILIIAVLLPGLFFFKSYHAQDFSSKYFNYSVIRLIPTILLPSILFHAILFAVLNHSSFSYEPKLEVFVVLLTSNDSEEFKKVFSSITSNFYRIFLYFFVVYLLSIISGFAAWAVIRKTKLDRKMSPFRFPNKWYYIFTGETFDFPNKNSSNSKFQSSENIDIRYIDALVQVGNYSIIYSGILQEFALSNSSTGVEFIKLTNVRKKTLSIDGQPPAYRSIAGGYLVLPFSEIKNLNITYYDLKEFIQKF